MDEAGNCFGAEDRCCGEVRQADASQVRGFGTKAPTFSSFAFDYCTKYRDCVRFIKKLCSTLFLTKLAMLYAFMLVE